MLIGYARVSTDDQNLDLQRDALTQAGCSKLYEDKESGAKAERPGLLMALEVLRDGDTLVVWRLDRLGRSLQRISNPLLRAMAIALRIWPSSLMPSLPKLRRYFPRHSTRYARRSCAKRCWQRGCRYESR